MLEEQERLKAFKAVRAETPGLEEKPTDQSDPYAAEKAIIKRALKLSFIVYDPLKYLETELAKAGFTRIQPLNVFFTGTQGLCCIRNDTAFIVFRGSASLLDWILDFLFIPFYWPLRHFGFGSAWLSVRGSVTKWLGQHQDKIKKTIICGHSLGGGISHMAAMGLAKDFRIDSVVTFGAPRAAFLGTAARYNEMKIKDRPDNETLGENTYAVVNQRDIVSKVPFEFLGFREVGRLVYIDFAGKIHHGEAAHSARMEDSMTDMNFMLKFLEDEKAVTIGPGVPDFPGAPKPSFYEKLKSTIRWIGRAFPFLKAIILLPVLYIITCLHFMRSGLAHMGDQYMKPFAETPQSWDYEDYEKSGLEKAFSFTVRFLMFGAITGLFLWGLVIIGGWFVSSVSELIS